jgi:hypothetical protein
VAFSQDVPGIFTNTAPPIFTNDVPVIFSQDVPLFDRAKINYPSGKKRNSQEEPCQKEG